MAIQRGGVAQRDFEREDEIGRETKDGERYELNWHAIRSSWILGIYVSKKNGIPRRKTAKHSTQCIAVDH